jgi:dTDP-4-amino-4,6-dideoxygalactose transaminase
MIPFNKPYFHGRELYYISQAIASGKLSGDGTFTRKCHEFFTTRYGFKKPLLTTSCTDALEMSALLANIKEGDEVIVPSFTFVSTANAFALRGATLVFADSAENNPNIDFTLIESLVNHRTRAICVVHYAGVACDMDAIMSIADRHNLIVVEDAAQAIDSYYKGRPLGSIGHLGAFSFHETKNVISGEGGLITVNNERYFHRAEIVREKGTNRSAYFRGEVDKYGWVELGSSFLPSEMIAAYLYGQLENLDSIQNRRKEIWSRYWTNLAINLQGKGVSLPEIPQWATNNAHMFYLVTSGIDQRTRLIEHLRNSNISAVFHYLSLHSSPYFKKYHDGRALPNSDRFTDSLVRLPLYYEMTNEDVDKVSEEVISFLK